MKDFVLSVLKMHCLIYKKNFEYYGNLFINKENTKTDNFIFEFINGTTATSFDWCLF